MGCVNIWSARMEKTWHIHRVTLDLVLSIRAVTVFFRWKSLAAASVKTKISEEGGADVSASYQSYTGQKKLFIWSIRLKPWRATIQLLFMSYRDDMIISVLLLYKTLMSKLMIPRKWHKYKQNELLKIYLCTHSHKHTYACAHTPSVLTNTSLGCPLLHLQWACWCCLWRCLHRLFLWRVQNLDRRLSSR